ncbi:MAG: hypothetical protein JW953_20080 [Anaerolineae bacterium]|nr:hypothetical protein [Anaerolineae bacterium]
MKISTVIQCSLHSGRKGRASIRFAPKFLTAVGLGAMLITLVSIPLALAASGVWSVDSDGNWSDPVNWGGGSYPNGITDTATFGNVISAPRTVAITENIAVSEMIFDSLYGYTLANAGGGSLTFANGGTGLLTVNTTNGNGDHAVSAPVILNRNLNITQNSAQTLTISGDIGQDATNRALYKNGTGPLLLSGNNTYGGDTYVNASVLAIGSDTALGTGTLRPSAGSTIRAVGARVIANNLNLVSNMIFDGDSLGFTNTGIQLPGNRIIIVNNTTSFAKLSDPAGSRSFRKTGSGTLNLNLSDPRNPGDYIRNEGSSTGPLNLYGTGTVGRLLLYNNGYNSRLAPGDTLDVAAGNVTTGTGTLTVKDQISLHPDLTLDIDLSSSAVYDQLTYNNLQSANGCSCVQLNEATLDVDLDFAATVGATFTIISRAGGSELVYGNFKNLPQGAVFLANSQQLLINYMPIQSPTQVILTRVDIPSLNLKASGGSGQSANVGTDFTLPLQVTVLDGSDNPVPNVRITFAAPDSSASAVFPNGLVGLTDDQGIVTATVQANAIPGAYTVTANIGPEAVIPASFTLSNVGGTLQVTKTVDWQGATPDPAQEFAICVSGLSYPGENCQTTDYDGGVLTWTNLMTGSYTVTETDPGVSWIVGLSGSSATVTAGQTAQVNVTNTYVSGANPGGDVFLPIIIL